MQRMVNDASAHAEEDKQLKELAEARNAADSLAYQVEKQISELGEKRAPRIKRRWRAA